jgi:hypothetical protein
MTNLRQLHDRYGQSSWLTTAPAVTSPATGPAVWHRSETDMFPGQHDQRK